MGVPSSSLAHQEHERLKSKMLSSITSAITACADFHERASSSVRFLKTQYAQKHADLFSTTLLLPSPPSPHSDHHQFEEDDYDDEEDDGMEEGDERVSRIPTYRGGGVVGGQPSFTSHSPSPPTIHEIEDDEDVEGWNDEELEEEDEDPHHVNLLKLSPVGRDLNEDEDDDGPPSPPSSRTRYQFRMMLEEERDTNPQCEDDYEEEDDGTPIRTTPPPSSSSSSSLSGSRPLTRSQTKKKREDLEESMEVEDEGNAGDVQDEEWGRRGGDDDDLEDMEAVFRVASKIMRTPPKASSHLV